MLKLLKKEEASTIEERKNFVNLITKIVNLGQSYGGESPQGAVDPRRVMYYHLGKGSITFTLKTNY